MIRRIFKYFHDFNLFELETMKWEGFDRPVHTVATRLFIVLLLLSLILLACFVGLEDQTETITARNPSQSTFLELAGRYSSTLSCPCRHITIPFGLFTSITTNYHPICNSVFVSNQWINLMFNPNISLYYPLDFRSTALGHFQLLSSLCSLARRFVNDAIDDFSNDTFLTQVVLSRNSLEVQVETRDNSMQISTINDFRKLLELLRKATASNWLATALQTSVILLYYRLSETSMGIAALEGIFSHDNESTCRCDTVSTCTSSLTGFFDIIGTSTQGKYIGYDSLITEIIGFVAGCYPIESLLKSTLVCLFDFSCLSNIMKYFPPSSSSHFDHLDSLQTKFSTRSTVDSLLDNLFIDHWTLNVSFDNYYDECAPILCTYTSRERASLLYIITQLLGFYGGLTFVLRLLIPRIVFAVFRRHRSRHRSRQINLNLALLFKKIRLKIIEWNLFKIQEEQHDLYELQTSRIATRIFLILSALCVIILSIYTTAIVRLENMVIHNPSEIVFRDLSSKYSSSLKCPCNRIAIEYGTFTNLSPRYHSICSSQFITAAWMESTSSSNWMDQIFESRDFRANARVFFNALSTFCKLIQSTVLNSWFVFKRSFLITELGLADAQLMMRATDSLYQFQSETLTEFKQVLRIIQFEASTLFAMGSQNYALLSLISIDSTEPSELYTVPKTIGNCSCGLNDLCPVPIGFFNSSPEAVLFSTQPLTSRYDIPQFFTGCFVLQSTLQSSLQCFFNQTCLDIIQSEIISPKSINISILQSNHSRFQPETLVGELVDELMIEDWGESIDYSKYYTQCQPKQCSYSINRRGSISFIVAFLIGLCGGVIAALKIIVPLFIRFLRQRCRPKLDSDSSADRSSTYIEFFRETLTCIRTKVFTFNLFETELSWNNAERQRHEIISTWIYSILLTITFVIMLLYTVFSMKTQTITIDHPSQSIFEHFRSNDALISTLRCPCQNISIAYQYFTSISFHLHQLCSSDLIQHDSMWMNLLNIVMIGRIYAHDDYRRFALLHFRLLSSLCQLANDTIVEAVNRFDKNDLITGQVESRESIVAKMKFILGQIRTSTARKFVRTLDFTTSITQGNGIIAGLLSNWRYMIIDRIHLSTIWTFPRSYDHPPNCSCATSSMCTSLAAIDGAIVPGFRVGCYALDSLLQSTLECLYDRNCLEIMQGRAPSRNFTITPLNSSLSSPNATVQSLIDDLFINEWKTNVSYEKYYESCAPLFCSYSINQRADLIYIVTAAIGFYGGLSTAIRIIAPMMAKIGQYIWIFYQTKRLRQNMIIPIND